MNRKAKAMEFLNESYNIKITGRHVEVTEAMKQYALEKISKVERFSNRIIDVNVIMDIQKLEHRVEIILKVNHTKIRSQASSQDMYASIDMAINKIESQLRRYKTKLQSHHAKSLAVVDMKVNVLQRLAYEDEEEEEEHYEEQEEELDGVNGEQLHKTPTQETRPLKTLSTEEAIMKIDLSQDAFLIFKHEEDQKLKVIYRRKDGRYGIIEPQC